MEQQEPSLIRQSFQRARALIEQHRVQDAGVTPAWYTPIDTLMPAPPALPPGSPPTAPSTTPYGLTVQQAAQQIAEGALSAEDLMQQTLAAVQQHEEALNAFVHIEPAANLLAQARQCDAERISGALRGPLHGIPISVKDVIMVADMPSTASSTLLADAIATVDAGAVQRLKAAGAIMVGKTHTHEFALGVTTPQSRHPLDQQRDPGGSSGGAAISLVTGMSLAALGTDTRASIRVPAALCGLVGFKPTFGLVPTDGVITLSWSLDTVAPMTRSVGDAALMLEVLANQPGQYVPALRGDVRGLRVGVPAAALREAAPDVLAVFEQGLARVADLGVAVETTDFPNAEDFDLAVSLGLVVSRCEAAAYHQAAYGEPQRNQHHYTRPVFEQLDEASQVPAVDYLQAQRVRSIIRDRVLKQFARYDVLATPTCLVTAPLRSEVQRYFLVLSQNCILWSFIGVPAMTVPCGTTAEGLPVGLQLVGPPLADGRLLALAAAIEQQRELDPTLAP
jgi:aspartyl-tRNA(Asn)/glutamyl-tRNA(Gln) amidotransferase subunit A